MTSSFNKFSLLFLCMGSLSSPASAQAGDCTALVDFQQDLWLAKANSPAASRVSNEPGLKPATALHPTTSLVAYSVVQPSSSIVVSDASGRVLERLTLNASEPIVSLTWVSPTLLRAGEHRGPKHGKYHFFSLGTGNRLTPLPDIAPSGGECALSPKKSEAACISADTVTLGDKDLYYAQPAADTNTVLQTITLALGTSTALNVSPAVRVEFKAQSVSGVSLRIVTTDGQWSEMRLSPGQSMVVPGGDDTPSVRLEALRSADPAVIKLVVKNGSGQQPSFEGNIAWDPNSERIAIVESNGAPRRTGVILHRQTGQAAIKGGGAVDARFTLPIDGPVEAVRFVSSTTVRFEGRTQAVEYPIPAHGKAPAGNAYSIKPVIPSPSTIHASFSGMMGTGEVRAWVCK
jgi:hypothetical protein